MSTQEDKVPDAILSNGDEEEEGIKLKSTDEIDDNDNDDEEDNDQHKGSVPLAGELKEGPLTKLKRNLLKYPDLLGFILTGISTILFSLSSMTVKYISGKFSAYEIVFFRCVVQFTLGSIAFLVSADRKEKPYLMGHLDRRVTPILTARGFFGAIAMILTFTSLHYFSLSDSVLIGFLGPVFTAIWGFIILREKSSILEVIGFCFSFAGISLVARPPFLLKLFHMSTGEDGWNSSASSSSYADAGKSVADRTIGVIIGLFYAVFSGLVCALTRKIGKSVHPMVVVNWLSLFGTALPIPIMAFISGFVMPHGTDWLYLIAIGCFTTLAQRTTNNNIHSFIYLFVYTHAGLDNDNIHICLLFITVMTHFFFFYSFPHPWSQDRDSGKSHDCKLPPDSVVYHTRDCVPGVVPTLAQPHWSVSYPVQRWNSSIQSGKGKTRPREGKRKHCNEWKQRKEREVHQIRRAGRRRRGR